MLKGVAEKTLFQSWKAGAEAKISADLDAGMFDGKWRCIKKAVFRAFCARDSKKLSEIDKGTILVEVDRVQEEDVLRIQFEHIIQGQKMRGWVSEWSAGAALAPSGQQGVSPATRDPCAAQTAKHYSATRSTATSTSRSTLTWGWRWTRTSRSSYTNSQKRRSARVAVGLASTELAEGEGAWAGEGAYIDSPARWFATQTGLP